MVTKSKWGVFGPAFEKRLARNVQSDEFIRLAPYAIKRRLEETCGFEEFNEVVKYRIKTNPKLPGWLQLRFGSRLLFRPDPRGNPSAEDGPSLVYSRGPTGEMTVIMFPIKSEVASVNEDSIILRIGYFDYWQLYNGVGRDIKDLIAYAYVTSIDLTPTLGQRIRIGWLRFANRQHVDGKHHYSPLSAGLKNIGKLAFVGSFQGIFRFAAPLALGWFIGRYGTDWLTRWLP